MLYIFLGYIKLSTLEFCRFFVHCYFMSAPLSFSFSFYFWAFLRSLYRIFMIMNTSMNLNFRWIVELGQFTVGLIRLWIFGMVWGSLIQSIQRNNLPFRIYGSHIFTVLSTIERSSHPAGCEILSRGSLYPHFIFKMDRWF